MNPFDGGREIDWGKTSADYAAHRPGPPESFYGKLAVLGVGLKGQRILDLGTGTGVLAREFARRGAIVAGVDISPEQIAMAKDMAAKEGLRIDFQVSPAERTPHPDVSFDAITANQCWFYFDKPKAVAEVDRLLAPGGVLVTSQFSWLPRLDPIARQMEDLVRSFNPQWSSGDWSGEIPECPRWAEERFKVRAAFHYDEPIPFTRETWRGRIRACRGVGASLSPEEVGRFDREFRDLLECTVPERFTVLHRIDAHIFQFK